MAGFPAGMAVLVAVSLLIYFGLAQRVLDRLYLTDKTALLVVAGIAVGSFLDLPLARGRWNVSLNIGGALIPLALAIYVFAKAGTAKERWRALIAAAGSALAVFLVNRYLFGGDPWQRGSDFLDPLYVYPLAAGLVAYLLGRSRRAAFFAATVGVLALDVFDLYRLVAGGLPGRVAIGGAGAFDIMVLSGIFAVLLAELIGEGRERLQGGPASEGRPPSLLRSLKAIPGGRGARKPLPERKERGGGEDHA